MAIDFQPLRSIMQEKGITWYKLSQEGIDNRTIHRLKHDCNTTTDTIAKLCDIIDCDPDDIIRRVPKSDVLQ